MDFEQPVEGLRTDSDGSPSNSTTFNRIVRNMMALGSAQVLTMAASAATALVLPKFLGDVNLGKLAFANAYTTYFGLMTGLGTATYLSKEVARDRKLAARYVLNAALMRLPLSLVTFVMGVLLINLVGYDDFTKKAIYILFVGTMLSSVYGVVFGALQGLQDMRAVAASQVAIKVVLAVTIIALLATGHGLLEVAAAHSLSAGVGLLIVLYGLLRQLDFRLSIDFPLWRQLLAGGLPFVIWQASLVVYGKVDRLMLGAMTGDAVLGWYAAAFRITSIYAFAPVIVMTVVFPALSAAAVKKNQDEFRSIARRALQAVLLTSVPMATGVFLLADRFIDALNYPAAFQNSIPLIMILAITSPLVATDMIIGSAVNAVDKHRQWAMVAVGAAALNPALNGFMIPLTQSAYGNGAIGAAIATLCTEVFMMAMGLWLLPGGVFDLSTLSNAARIAASALIMAAAVLLVHDMFLLVPVAVGAAVYGLSCLLLRAVVISDLRRFWTYFLERQQARMAVSG